MCKGKVVVSLSPGLSDLAKQRVVVGRGFEYWGGREVKREEGREGWREEGREGYKQLDHR